MRCIIFGHLPIDIEYSYFDSPSYLERGMCDMHDTIWYDARCAICGVYYKKYKEVRDGLVAGYIKRQENEIQALKKRIEHLEKGEETETNTETLPDTPF